MGEKGMGLLINGKWSTEWYEADAKGRFIRPQTSFRRSVTADGSSGFKAKKGRYHLYASLACPWAHRTLIMRRLKKLEDSVSLSVVDYLMGEDGWVFSDKPGCIPDTVNGRDFLRDIYIMADPLFAGRVTVPVLWDKEKKTIVNNESSVILRMLDLEFDAFGDGDVTFYPEGLRDKIDRTMDIIYMPINNGVYRAGFATSQDAYDEAVRGLFAALDFQEEVLSGQRYLCGDVITEADWCLFTTLIRFDLVYYTHFKCNLRHIYEYPNLWNYLKELYQVPGVSDTCSFEHIKGHYFRSHPAINPYGIVPMGPVLDFNEPHNRG